MQLLISRQKNHSLEEQLLELQRKLGEACKEREKSSETGQEHGDSLIKKLSRDLEMQNHLIDQLNDESIPAMGMECPSTNP